MSRANTSTMPFCAQPQRTSHGRARRQIGRQALDPAFADGDARLGLPCLALQHLDAHPRLVVGDRVVVRVADAGNCVFLGIRMSLIRSPLCLTSTPRLWAIDVDFDDLAQVCRARRRTVPAAVSHARPTMPACRAAPRATTSLTASEWSGSLPLISRSMLAGHRHVRRAADQQDAIDLVPGQPAPGAAPAASSGACASAGRASASRIRPASAARVSTLPACVQVIVVCGSLLSVRLARSAAACSSDERLRDRSRGSAPSAS